MSLIHYDACIVGSGQAGTPLASALANSGKKTVLVEGKHVAGCCVNEGCTPTKTMIASGRVAYLARRGKDYGLQDSKGDPVDVSVNMLTVRQRKRDIVNSFRGGSEKRVKDAGIDLLEGEASFLDAKRLSVKKIDGSVVEITAESIFINTGERPAKPDLPGLDTVASDIILDSTSIQELSKVPEHLLVLGGGYIGLEFGQLFRRLGAHVTIIQRGSQLLPREDPDISKTMLDILREDGITVHLNTRATSIIQRSPNDHLSLSIKSVDGESHEVLGSHLLVAAGRSPNTDMLNLNGIGIETTNRGHIIANDRLETNLPGIFALGDVKGPPAFTHISYDDFRIIRANIIDKNPTPLTTTDRVVPYVVYTDPQLGHVGLHEAEARAKYPDRTIKTAKMPMSYVARALETDESRGLMKAVVDDESGQILGFSCLGLEGGEIMSIVQMAMIGGQRWEKLRDAVWAHPTLAESLNNIWGFLE